MVMENQGACFPEDKKCELYIASMGEKAQIKATELCTALRNEGFIAQSDVCARGLKAQMRFANKLGAQFCLVLGDDEIASGKARLKNMGDSTETEISLDDICGALYSAKTNLSLESLTDSVFNSEVK